MAPRCFHVQCKQCGAAFDAQSGAAKWCSSCREQRKVHKEPLPNSGRFAVGEPRVFHLTCRECSGSFDAPSGNSRWCPSCRAKKRICPECGGKKLEYHQFCGNSCAGKWKYRNSEAVRAALLSGVYVPQRAIAVGNALRNKPRPSMEGENNPNWSGGSAKLRRESYGHFSYVQWRRAVFSRDDWTCRECHERGGHLNAHHVAHWAKCPERRYDVTNGITLCETCHRSQHKKAA